MAASFVSRAVTRNCFARKLAGPRSVGVASARDGDGARLTAVWAAAISACLSLRAWSQSMRLWFLDRHFDWVWLIVWGAVSSIWCLSASARLGATIDETTYLQAGLQR